MEQIAASLASLVLPPPSSSREQIIMEKPREEKKREPGEVRRKPLERTVEVKGGGWILILGGLLVASAVGAGAAIVARRAKAKRPANEKAEGLDGDDIQVKGDIDRSISIQVDDSVKPKESFLDGEELPICSKPVMNHQSDKILGQRHLALQNGIGEKEISSTDQCGNCEPQEQVQQILEKSESVLIDETKEEDQDDEDEEEEPILVDYHLDVAKNQRVPVLEKTEFVYVGKVEKVEVMSVLKSKFEMSQQQFEELLDAPEMALIHGEKDDREDALCESEHGMNHHHQTELIVQRLIPALGNEDKEDEPSPRKHKLTQMKKCDQNTISMGNKNVRATMIERDEEALVFAGKSSPREFEFEMAESIPDVSGESEPFEAKVMDEQQGEEAPQDVVEETNSQLQINHEQTEQFLDECDQENAEGILPIESESEINCHQTDQILEESEHSLVNEQKETTESQIQMTEFNSEMSTESESLSLNEDGKEDVKSSSTELLEETTSQVEMNQLQNEQLSNDAKLVKEEIEEKNKDKKLVLVNKAEEKQEEIIEGRKKITENMMEEKLMIIREKAVILVKFLMDIPERLLVVHYWRWH
ncbi:uncharacterized protein LOC141813820 [Curcuma longa]|uniref:uncharacterized protein LOC141813820 n=1 Tax=Curcuma longa TaxID=136217 RepID=UPI003D9EA9C2